ATPRFVGWSWNKPSGYFLTYRQTWVPVLASSAMMLFWGVVMNIRPRLTIGVVSCAPRRSVLTDQASVSRRILFGVICFSGLKPEPSYVRRYMSQSPASGCSSRASDTVGYAVDSAHKTWVTSRAAERALKTLR